MEQAEYLYQRTDSMIISLYRFVHGVTILAVGEETERITQDLWS